MPNLVEVLTDAFFGLARASTAFWDVVTTPFRDLLNSLGGLVIAPFLPDVILDATILEASLMGFALVYVVVCIAKFFTDVFGL